MRNNEPFATSYTRLAYARTVLSYEKLGNLLPVVILLKKRYPQASLLLVGQNT